MHFDPAYPIVVACDASAHGIGAVLSNKLQMAQRNQLALSRTLTGTEQKYPQVGKGLACIFGVSHYHTYLFDYKFTLVANNKALMSLFDPSRNVSPQASGRIQHWSLKLSMYQYVLQFCPTASTWQCRCFE